MSGTDREKRRDVLLNGRQCAESIGIAYRNFLQWKVPTVGKDGRQNLYALQDVLKVYRERVAREITPGIRDEVRAEFAAGENDEENLNPAILKLQLDNERRRLTAAQADHQEEKNRMMRHEIAPFEFITHALGSLSNTLAAYLDGLPTLLVRQAGIEPAQAEKVREAGASVANDIASIADKEWVSARYDDYLAEMDK